MSDVDVIEEAGTGRAKCRRCQEKIEKGELRFGERVPNAFGEGDTTRWFHLACAAEKRPEKLLEALKLHEGEIPERDRLERIAAEGVENPALAGVIRVERAASGRAACQQCREKIGKGELRIVVERDAEPPAMSASAFVHVGCGPEQIGTQGLLDKLLRTSPDLPGEDREELTRLLTSA